MDLTVEIVESFIATKHRYAINLLILHRRVCIHNSDDIHRQKT